MKPQSIPQAVLILADYQYKAAFVADQEINTVACLTELMVNCEFN
jgi:replication factor C small subunit